MVLIADLYGTGPTSLISDHDIIWRDRVFGTQSYLSSNPLLLCDNSGKEILSQFLAKRFLEVTPSSLRLALDLAIAGQLQKLVDTEIFVKTLQQDRGNAQIFFNKLCLLLEDNVNNYRGLTNLKNKKKYVAFADNLAVSFDYINSLRELV